MNEAQLLRLLGHLIELHDALTRRRVRAGRREFRQAVAIIKLALDEVRSR